MTQNKRNIENVDRPLFMKGEIVETSIVDISHQGKGIGKINGFPIFIDGGVIDDKVKIEITKVKKNFAFGKLMEVLEKSEFRIKPACEISQVCGGCDFMETRYDKQLEIKENFVKNSIMRIGGFAEGDFKFNSIVGLPKGDELYYRNKATLEISTGGNRLKKGGTIENLEEVKIGFKARGTHKVVHCDKCYIQHPVVSAVIKATKNFMDEDNISAWDEKWAQGLMRHMIVRVSESSKEVMVIFIINGKGIPNGEKLISIMDEAVYAEGYFLESVCVSTRKDKVKNGEIYGKKVAVYAGKPVIHDEMMGMNFEVSPRSFYQVNPKMTEKLYSKVKELVGATENDVILDIKRHPIGMLIPAIVSIFLVVIIMIFVMFYPSIARDSILPIMPSVTDIFGVAMLLIGLVVLGGAVALWIYLQNQFFMTNESVIQEIQESLFSRREQTVSLGSIEDASFRQSGIIQTIFNYGTIRLSTEGEETTYRFHFVANPREQIAIINNAIEDFKNGRPVDD